MIFGKKKKEIPFLYELKESLVTDTEMEYLECIEDILPEGYLVLPRQIWRLLLQGRIRPGTGESCFETLILSLQIWITVQFF